MAVNKITGFRAPYKSDTFRDIADSIEGLNGLLDMDGPITQVGPTITLPAFRVVQDGLIYEKTLATTLSAPALAAPFYLVVTAPTPNPLDDLIFTFAKSPEDISIDEVILGAYDGQEWRIPDKVTIKAIFDLIAQTNIDTLRIGPFSGLRTSLNGGNYDNSPGTLVDKRGQSQNFTEIASFPVVAVDPDWDRVDRILYRRPMDSANRIGIREFLLGGTYDSSPAMLSPVQSFNNSKVRQAQKVLIAPDNTAHILTASGSGTVFQIDYTKISSDRLSTLVAPMTLFTGVTRKAFGAAIDGAGNFHVVYEKTGNIFYRKFSSVGAVLVGETVIDSQAGACSYPAVSIDPADTKVFIVYQSLLGPSNNQIFFTSRSLLGALITAAKPLTATAQNLITPDIFVSEDLFVYVAWANQTLGSILYQRFDDIGDVLDPLPTTVSTGVVQIGVGTLTGGAASPRIFVAGNREVFVLFKQDKGASVYGISVYTGGAAFMQELTGPAENFTAFDIQTDPIFNSLMLTLVQATSVDFVKVYGQTVSFVLNLVAGGSRGVAAARDRLGSLLHAIAGAAAGTYTSYDATSTIIAFGAVSVVGGITTINVGANQFLATASTLSQLPNADDQVVITGSGIGGNNTTKLILTVELLSLNSIDDVYRITVLNNFTASESPATANGNFQAPDGNNAVYIKSVSESQDQVFSLFELGSDILLSRMVAPGTTILNWLPPGSAGDLADFLIIGGSGSVDWEKTSAGEFTMAGTVKVSNIFTATEYLLTPGGYPMVEGDALYVLLDPSDLSPTPLVTPIPTLPWNMQIGVIGIIMDGNFEPSMANLRPLISQEQLDLGQALPVAIRDRLGVIDDVSFDAYTSTEHIDLTDNYAEAISNLDTGIQNIIGQIFMTPESPISKRVRVSASDKTLLSGSIFGIKYKERLIDFSGARIDFSDGSIYEDDGVTPLGENFSPVVPAAGMWRWLAVNLLPDTIGADNRLSIKFKVTPASIDGATQDAAPRATFSNQPDVGQVAIFSTNGSTISNIDYGNLLNLLTNFSTSEGSGGSSNQLLVSGNIAFDWEDTAVGEFTFGAGLRIEDVSINFFWLPASGSYPMIEGDAIYIELDTAIPAPVPLVTPIGSLPVTDNIYVIGVIRDGAFIPTSPSLNVLESGEVRILGEDLSTQLKDRLGVVSDTAYDAYTSPKSVNAADSYPEAISNLDAAINKILEQISIYPKSPISSRVRITGADKILLDGTVLGMQVENLLVDFDGAEIDFQTGIVYASDGVTPLGNNFTPSIPAAGRYLWFALNLEPVLPTANNRVTFKLLVAPALSTNAVMNTAARAEFTDDPKVGEVAVFSTGGVTINPIPAGQIVNLLTLDVGSGGGGSSSLKADAGENLIENNLVYVSPGAAQGDTGRVAGRVYLVDAGNAVPALADIRSRAVGFAKATVLTAASAKIQTGGLRKNFVGLITGQLYYANPSVPGGITLTKPTALGAWVVPIGVASSTTELMVNPSAPPDSYAITFSTSYPSVIYSHLENELQDSIYDLLTEVDFSVDLGGFVDGASTGAYSYGLFRFTAGAQTFVSINLFDASEYLISPTVPNSIDLTVFWDAAALDTAAVYAVSRNGGGTYQTVTMDRLGNATNAYTGSLTFAAEADASIGANSAAQTSTYELNITGQTTYQVSFTLASASVLRIAQLLSVVKTGSPLGSYFVDICENNAGAPGAVIATTAALSVGTLVSGNVSADVSDVALKAATTYWIVIRTDATYKASFSAGVTSLSLSLNGSGLRRDFLGFVLDLRVRVTSSAGSKSLAGFGIFYEPLIGRVQGGAIRKDTKVFTTTDNLNVFTLNFFADPDLLKVYHVETGQVYHFPAFAISGQTITFPVNTFSSILTEVVTLIFLQIEGTSFDNADMNAALLAANFLGSIDGALDRSSPGRGIFLRRPDGTLREICLNNSDEIEVYSV